jgi:hypothetical protein
MLPTVGTDSTTQLLPVTDLDVQLRRAGDFSRERLGGAIHVAVLAITCALLLPPAAMAQSWGTYQGNASHTGYVPVTINASGIQHLWTRTFSAPLNPVAIGAGRVFVSESETFAANRGLYALDANTGGTVWSYPDFGAVFSVNPPAYADGTVYLQTGQGTPTLPPYLYSFDAADGTPRFRVPFAAQWERYLAPTLDRGDVFVNGGTYGGAYRFDGANGAERWFAELPQYDDWTPAVDGTHAYAYVGEDAPGLYVLDRQTGTLAFTIPDTNFQWDGWSMGTAPVLTHDGDVLATHDGRLIRFDVQGRRIDWEVDRNFLGQATVRGDVIYVNDGGTLTAWNALAGTLLWTWIGPGGGGVDGNIVVTDTHVFVQSTSTTYAVRLSTRTIDWSYAAAGSIAIGDGVLAITDDASLHLFSITDPSLPLPPTGLAATAIVGNQVSFRFTPSAAGAVPTGYLLEGGALPGQTLASLPLGAVPEHTISAPDGVFYVRVRSMVGSVVSAASNEVRIFVNQAVPPSPPTSLTGLAFGSSLRLAWKNTFDGGAVDRVVLDVTGPISTSLPLGPAETFAFDGVPPGTYVFSVRAQNSAGTSGSSSGVSLTFPATCSGAPQAPPDLLAYRIGNVVQLRWDPPSSGSAPTSYRVGVTGAFTGSFQVLDRSIGGAVGSGVYNLSVAALNACGMSVPTPVRTVVVP